MPPNYLPMPTDVRATIRDTKRMLREHLPTYKEVFDEIEEFISAQVEIIKKEQAAGIASVPEVQAQEIFDGSVSESLKNKIRQRGCAVIHGVFPRDVAAKWNEDVKAYLDENNFEDRLNHAAVDKYFSELAKGKPQIYGVYWSKPQIEARQSERMKAVQVFMNSFWKSESNGKQHFEPKNIVTYADRLRRRPPHSPPLGLSPHVDSGTIERWLDYKFRHVYRNVFSGNWGAHNPYDAEGRTEVREIKSPAMCSAFRTFQGWTALSPQRKNGGTLRLVPIINAIPYMLLRSLQDDVPEDDFCGAQPGRALGLSPEWHSLLLEAECPIPEMEPGDCVFWHCDLVHSVEAEHEGEFDSNVIYIACVPRCAKNVEYARAQWEAFLRGGSPPDFAADDFEVNFKGRARPEDLTPIGRAQMDPSYLAPNKL
ncbi:hypothetical protein ECC02_005238 [Trypanosoma cruzi]|uniref:DUF1479 domain-containing protein n=1 Tax=Trypanosoma cruzi TaxID=5693 RepID=A0A7J6Y620_TRYCR|nr:hypothetical protein ECC02_005238 [Trypanosoma cruzi]